MNSIVFLRHGESIWNKENKFTGWVDVGLSSDGIAEAKKAGTLLKEGKFLFTKSYTSELKRAINTTEIVLRTMGLDVPITRNWRLNERHYGSLQGMEKQQMVEKFGFEKVNRWRRSFKERPPFSKKSDTVTDEKGQKMQIVGESLEDTYARCIPLWTGTIFPEVEKGEKILVSAHGNSIRAIIKYIDDISDEDISGLEIPTGVPLVYEFQNGIPVAHFFLGNPDEIKSRIDRVKKQIKI